MGEEGIEPVKRLMESYKTQFGKNFNLNRTEGYWTTPLNYAIFMKLEKFAIFLLENGADPNFVDRANCISINYAVSNFDFHINDKTIKRKNIELPKLVVKLIVMGVNVCHRNGVNKMYPDYEAMSNDYNFSANQIQNKIDAIIKSENPNEIKLIENYLIDIKKIKRKKDEFFDLLISKDEIKSIQFIDENPDYVNSLDMYG